MNADNRSSRLVRVGQVLDIVGTCSVIALCAVAIHLVFHARAGESTSASPKEKAHLRVPQAPLSLEGAAIRGNKTAKVGLIVYSDFQCPFCSIFAQATLKEIEALYGVKGEVLIAFRHLPLETIHPAAVDAAQAAGCAGLQQRFWEMHDALFMDQRHLEAEALTRRAGRLGLDVAAFSTCLKGPTLPVINSDIASARELGITGTPTAFLGRVLQDGRVSVTKRLQGAQSLKVVTDSIETLLRQVDAASSR